jgi:hypothetical protein
MERTKSKYGEREDFFRLDLVTVAIELDGEPNSDLVPVFSTEPRTDEYRQRIANEIREFLKVHGPQSLSRIEGAVRGKASTIREVAAQMANLSLLVLNNERHYERYDLPAHLERPTTPLLELPPIEWENWFSIFIPGVCTRVATEVDHINGPERGNAPSNLRASCRACNARPEAARRYGMKVGPRSSRPTSSTRTTTPTTTPKTTANNPAHPLPMPRRHRHVRPH